MHPALLPIFLAFQNQDVWSRYVLRTLRRSMTQLSVPVDTTINFLCLTAVLRG